MKLAIATRRYPAPRAQVFAAWTRPAQLARWWSTPVLAAVTGAPVAVGDALRVRVGGGWVVVAVREVASPSRVVFAWGGDAAGTMTEVTATFTDDGAGTRVSVLQATMPATRPATDAAAMPASLAASWTHSLDRLAVLLAAAR